MPGPDPFGDLIAPFSRRGVDLGLERLQTALAELGHPERRFAAVQVAGTNGKGSISTMLERIAAAAGIRCGLYTSPHLLSWCERIRLPGGLIAEAELRRLLQALQPLALRHDLTPFELVTAAAFQAFAEAGVELVVLEVGLGGRLDATTVHPDRQVLALASIGLDHIEHLGPTLAAIAAEKAGVLHAGAVAVSGPQAPEAAAVLERQALALGAAQALAERGWPIDAAAMARGLATARWPGRLERRCFAGRPLLLDGAHNPPAAEALRRELDRLEPQAEEPQAEEPQSEECRAMERSTAASPRRWLIGIQRHKDAPQLLRALLRPGDALRVTALPEHACWRAAELRDLPELEAAQLEITDASGDLQADLAWLVASAALPVACGSLYLVAELLPLLDAEVPRQVVGNPTD